MLDRELVRGSTPSPDLQPEYLPMMLFAAWWNLALDSWCPACPPWLALLRQGCVDEAPGAVGDEGSGRATRPL